MQIDSQQPNVHLSDTIAARILSGFEATLETHQMITQGAKQRFERGDWIQAQRIHKRRIDVYKQGLNKTRSRVLAAANGEAIDWVAVKDAYGRLIATFDNHNISETWYNSLYRAVVDRSFLDDDCLFIRASRPKGWKVTERVYKTIDFSDQTKAIKSMLAMGRFSLPWEHLDRDIAGIEQVLQERVFSRFNLRGRPAKLQVLKELFFRNKGAYLVARLVVPGTFSTPLIIPILNNGKGAVYVDNLVVDSNELSKIFSFTRSYFMVNTQVPREYVNFLKQLMPLKDRAELYSSLGFGKHGKTVFYRTFLDHLANTQDQFVLAPGIKGMVMSVFTLPSLPVVFKLIKDRFDPPKTMTKALVKDRYRLVSTHDRMGRMADTQEFINLPFAKSRISPELLDELYKVAPSLIVDKGDHIVIKHLYTERRMTPLNIYVHKADDAAIDRAMNEYGRSIKELSAGNIFPGDMLLKNFGVTRHGRVVFYDYDEITYLHECNFRKLPQSNYDDEMFSAQPWYNVSDNDIFPEEFRLFFSGKNSAKEAFEKHHIDLYEADYWKALQAQYKAGRYIDLFPYKHNPPFRLRDHLVYLP